MELISDPTLYLFFERMKRGGLSYVGNRQAEANVPWDTTHYDPTKEICHLMYVGKLTIEGERSIDRSIEPLGHGSYARSLERID